MINPIDILWGARPILSTNDQYSLLANKKLGNLIPSQKQRRTLAYIYILLDWVSSSDTVL
ncbi:hypothetical protein HMPREF9104_00111 [Lentilactobacillus kisonensis F0435]|uniref:Uncharacterized protein n=1 Tax=Lentilactobacillus kisonensis F0435 TaxID=797516 RepID=H1LC00_9LACO|nr:hypothetical protein HMPREF9104_00111 [Lentilactobacillus kisonensis F0435]